MEYAADGKILIASSSERGTEFLKSRLEGRRVIDLATTAAEVRRKVSRQDYDAVIINCPLTDEYGPSLAEELVRTTASGIIAIVKSEVYDNVAARLERTGAFCLTKPLDSRTFLQGVSLAVATSRRMVSLQKRADTLEEKMNEIKLVARAKLLLISKLSFSENEAHKYIEKQAMDRCVKRTVIATEIIKTYDI